MQKPPSTLGVLLAGGLSRRMGRDKCLIHIDGVPLFRINLQKLQRVFTDVVISGDAAGYKTESCPVIPDLIKGIGPMGGLYSVLQSYPENRVLLLAADMPLLPESLLVNLAEHADQNSILLPAGKEGKNEPLAAIYPPAVLPTLKLLIQSKDYAMHSLFSRFPTRYLPYGKIGVSEKAFLNLNRPQDLLQLREIMGNKVLIDEQKP